MQLLFLGDIALAEANISGWEWPAPGGIQPSGEQRILFNWEFPLGQAVNPVRRVSGIRYLANPASIQVIKSWAPGFAALATNHILDGGEEGLQTTLETLRNAGFATLGAGCTPEEMEKPLIWETKEGRLGVINWVFPETHPDHCASTGPNCWPGPEKAAQAIQALKSQVDWVVLVLHWSDELFSYPRLDDRQIARELVNAGADMIVGHHPHVVRGFETILSRPVFYSIGNFFFSIKHNVPDGRSVIQPPRNREGLGVIATFKRGKSPSYRVLSFWREWGQVILDPKNRAAKRMAHASQPLERYSNRAYQDWYDKRRKRFNVWDYRINFMLTRLSAAELIQYSLRPVRKIFTSVRGSKTG